MLATESPFPIYTDTSGKPLDAGYLYFGQPNQNPETAPVAIYWDAAGTIPAEQPVRTLNGYTVRSGTPALVYTAGDYSLTVRTRDRVLIYHAKSSEAFGNAAALSQIVAGFSDSADVAKGDALVAVKHPAFGGVVRTQHGKNTDSVSIFDFGAGLATDGTADWSAAFSAANAASLSIDCGDSSHIFRLSSPVVLRSGTTLFGEMPEIRQGTANTECFNIEGKSNIRFIGLVGRGIGTDHSDSDSSRACFAYGGTSGSNIQTLFCRLYSFAYTPVRHAAITGVVFGHNLVEGPGAPTLTAVTSGRCYGVLADAGCANVQIFGNTITKTAQGARIEQVNRFSVSENIIHDVVGQHGLYLGSGLTNGAVSGNVITNVSLIGIKLQAQNGNPDTRLVSIDGNVITGCGDQGILLCNGGGPTDQAAKNRGVVVSGNAIRTTVGTGLNIQNVVGCTVTNNTVDGAGFSGINLSAATRARVEGNVIQNCGLSGIRDEAPCTEIIIGVNTLSDNATANTPGDRFGILVQSMTGWTIDDNTISDAAAKMQYGIYCSGGDQTTLLMRGNNVLQSTDYALRVKNNTDAPRAYSGNLWNGTLGPAFNEPAVPTVAAAATVTLPQQAPIVVISGAGGPVTTLNASGHAGRIVSLILTSTAQLTDGGNIKLAGNASGAANRTLTLLCDGTNWWESARAAT